MDQQFFAPAFPTHPVQDKFNQIHISFGLNKLEYMSAIIAAQLAGVYSDKCLPETIAEEAIAIAISTLEKCDEELKKSPVTTPSAIVK